MKYRLLLLMALLLPLPAQALPGPGMQGLQTFKHCVMENNVTFCRSMLTPGSYEIFDRFVSYKLMPCLPTDFIYEDETTAAGRTVVKASMPASPTTKYIFRLVFVNSAGNLKLDIPESLHTGLGDNWQNKMQLAEQLYLMMKQNMGDKLTCGMLNDLVKK